MVNKTMGEIICNKRKEKNMTQKELADKLNITDKAVSKWERNVSCPDTITLPKLAEILGISVEELLNVKADSGLKEKRTSEIVNLILKVIPIAMGVAVTVLSILGELESKDAITMLGIGMSCIGIYLLQHKEQIGEN